jgi:hypothetical protein
MNKFNKVITISLLGFVLLTSIQSCFLFKGKNKCDSCPGIIKHKRTKKSTKGSI